MMRDERTMIARDLLVYSGGNALRGTVLAPSSGGHRPLVILCHGIPSGITVEGEPGYEALARRFVELGAGACWFNFRGTGLSDGNFSLPGWADDLDAVLDAAGAGGGPFEGCDPDRTALVGFSAGGAVSIICAAGRRGLKGVAVLSAPADFTGLMPKEGMGSFIAHARDIGIVRDAGFPPSEEDYYREMVDFNPEEKVSALAPVPLLVVHGDLDDLVPLGEAYRLHDAAAEPKELYVVKGGGHRLRLNPEAMDVAVPWIMERLQ